MSRSKLIAAFALTLITSVTVQAQPESSLLRDRIVADVFAATRSSGPPSADSHDLIARSLVSGADARIATNRAKVAAASTLSAPASRSLHALMALTGIPVGAKSSSITAAAPLATISPSNYNFGNVGVGSSASFVATITNVSGNPLTFESGYPSTDAILNPGSSLSNSICGTVLGAGQSCSFTVTYTPLLAGSYSGYVFVRFNESSDLLYIALGALGVGPVALSAEISPSSYNFGSTTVGNAVSFVVSLANTGAGDLSFRAGYPMTDSSINPGSTITASTCGSSIAVGQSCNVTVTWNPTQSGAYSGYVFVKFNEITNLYWADLYGMGVGPVPLSATISPTSHDFGTIAIGSTGSFPATVTNTGAARLNFKAGYPMTDAILNPGSSITGSTCGAGLDPSESCVITVAFTAQLQGSYSGYVFVKFDEITDLLYANLYSEVVSTAFTLNVSKAGTGSGSVASADMMLTCGNTCAHAYAVGATPMLTATADPGSVFVGWLGSCAGPGVCSPVMSGDKTVSATFAHAPFDPYVLDVDGNAKYDALTDGLLIVRNLLGQTGTALTSGALGEGATLTDPTLIAQRLVDLKPLLDVDGDGKVDALSDGTILLRYLFGLRGDTLLDKVIAASATRTSSSEVETYIQSLVP